MPHTTAYHAALLTPSEMSQADELTIKSGTPGYTLMQRAGEAIFNRIRARFPSAHAISILCGPGNNGGDGFVVARLLKTSGHEVSVGLVGDPGRLKGDAARACQDWTGETENALDMDVSGADLIIDALFGAGLSRGLEGELADLVNRVNSSGKPVLSVDLPSGLDGRTGHAAGAVIKADASITFHRKKPGHLLYPGRGLCGEVETADIGIVDHACERLDIQLFENTPDVWRDAFPEPESDGHKYGRGSVMVLSGPEFATGASRLSAQAALRAGAGLVSICGPKTALRIHAAHVTAVMLKPGEGADDLRQILSDDRISACILGPGLGTDERALSRLETTRSANRPLILDADAITCLAQDPARSFTLLNDLDHTPILTPHVGEFKRLFPDIKGDSKVEQARQAAAKANAIIVYKGADTVIAAPDGRAAINANAPPWLATAGSGDTLAGIIAGLRAQGMPAFEASCAGVWLHGAAGQTLGRGLTADDLDEGLKTVMRDERWKEAHHV